MTYYCFVLLGVFACACSQLLLKQSADASHRSFVRSLLNWRVLSAYVILFASLLTNIWAMGRGVQLKDMPILESTGYVFVPLLSALVLKERLTRRTLVSILLIVAGVLVFYC